MADVNCQHAQPKEKGDAAREREEMMKKRVSRPCVQPTEQASRFTRAGE
jgi:hypothetical protein